MSKRWQGNTSREAPSVEGNDSYLLSPGQDTP